MRRETQWTTRLLKELRASGIWCYKIPDMPFGRGDANDRTRFNPLKPVDVIACSGGRFYGIEAKFRRTTGIFKADQIRESQRAALEKIMDADGVAFVAVFVCNGKLGKKRIDRLYLWEWPDLRAAFDLGGGVIRLKDYTNFLTWDGEKYGASSMFKIA